MQWVLDVGVNFSCNLMALCTLIVSVMADFVITSVDHIWVVVEMVY